MDKLFPLFGIALIAASLLQFGLWTGRGLRLRRQERKKFSIELERLRAELSQITSQSHTNHAIETKIDHSVVHESVVHNSVVHQNTAIVEPTLPLGDWKGYRKFRVSKLVSETDHCKSVYLTPEDGMPIVHYQPGQHLTLKLSIPGQEKRAIRCYTLSDVANDAYYRISVKRCLPPKNEPNAPPGLVSYYINGQLKEGDVVELKSPSGTFYLQPGNGPVVLLAGGIGITPMLSIINSIAQSGSGRECLLVYGVGNRTDHAFKTHFAELTSRHTNIHVVSCYCNPLKDDRINHDFQVNGFVNIDILKQILPNNDYDFYLCGPPPFMQSIFDGLSSWGVDEARIRYEAFGPATIKKTPAKNESADQTTISCDVSFCQSKKSVSWTGEHENLLELMEDHGLPVESGCRAGSCGTCQTRLLSGSVLYQDPEQIECETGYCLPCVARPAEAIEIDA